MVYGIDRAVLFGALALLIGGVVFLVAVWPRGRDDRRAARVVWAGWIGVAVTTVLGIALEGVYAAGLPLTKVFDPTVFRDVLDTRYGKVALRAAGAARGRVPAAAAAAAPPGRWAGAPRARSGGWSPPASSASGSR